MISAQSLRPRLSGNKSLILVLLLMGWGLSACALFQKADTNTKTNPVGDTLDPIQGRKVYDPETRTYVTVEETLTEKMDTIVWQEVSSATYPPITSSTIPAETGRPSEIINLDKNTGSEFFSSYNVAVILPFLTDKFNPASSQIPDNASWALQFYGGLKIALDVLNDEGVNLNVSAIDSKASDQTVSSLVRNNSDLRNAHLIIGPYRRDNVAIIANELIKQQDNVLVSPYSAVSGISSDNPNYIQVNPTLETHCETIMRHALARYRPENIVLVSKDKPAELARLQYFHDEYKRVMNLRPTTPLREFIIKDESADFNKLNVMPFVSLGDTTVFIVPTWGDEPFVYSLLRKIELSKSPTGYVVVYGMPQWMAFDKIDFSYYEKLHVHISASSYIDPIAPGTQSFRQQYFVKFGTVPSEEAFLGYDVMLYFGRMLQKYGTKFQYSLGKDKFTGLETSFDIEPISAPVTGTGADRFKVDHFENLYLHILKFEDFQFKPAD